MVQSSIFKNIFSMCFLKPYLVRENMRKKNSEEKKNEKK